MDEELKEFSVYLEIQGTVLETVWATTEEEAKDAVITDTLSDFSDYTINKVSVLIVQGE